MKKKLLLFNRKIQLTMLAFAITGITAVVILLSGCAKKTNSIPNNIVLTPKDLSSKLVVLNTVTINVKSVGAVGNGTTDDTWAFQKAVDSVHAMGGGTVYVPTGTYLIDADVSINMKTNVTLNMVDTTRILKAKPTASDRFYVIKMVNVSSAKVTGGKIMGERTQHLGTTGEWGVGIGIYGCWSARVTDTHIVNCWGDGITIGSSVLFSAPNSSKLCVFTNVVCDNNRRQGLSIGEVDSLIVNSSTFTHTNGTAPQDGIDIEPDADTAQRVHITNCLIAYNTKVGVEMNAKTTTTAVIKNIFVQNNIINHDSYSGYVQHVSNVVFTNNTMTNNTYGGNHVHVAFATNSVFDPNTY
jgi:polygalacturonase